MEIEDEKTTNKNDLPNIPPLKKVYSQGLMNTFY